MLSGIGHGNSFPSLSKATGRPAIVDASTVEITGKGCCPAINGTLKNAAMKIFANAATGFILSTHAAYRSLTAFARRLEAERFRPRRSDGSAREKKGPLDSGPFL